jgi:hypothetical protein
MPPAGTIQISIVARSPLRRSQQPANHSTSWMLALALGDWPTATIGIATDGTNNTNNKRVKPMATTLSMMNRD